MADSVSSEWISGAGRTDSWSGCWRPTASPGEGGPVPESLSRPWRRLCPAPMRGTRRRPLWNKTPCRHGYAHRAHVICDLPP